MLARYRLQSYPTHVVPVPSDYQPRFVNIPPQYPPPLQRDPSMAPVDAGVRPVALMSQQLAPPPSLPRPLLQKQQQQPMFRPPPSRRVVAARIKRQDARRRGVGNSAAASEQGEHAHMTSPPYEATPPYIEGQQREEHIPRASTSDAYTQQMYDRDVLKLCQDFMSIPQVTITPLIDMPPDNGEFTEISIEEVRHVIRAHRSVREGVVTPKYTLHLSWRVLFGFVRFCHCFLG